MLDRRCLVLTQHRNTSEYNDFIGKYYHFPKKYKNVFTEPGTEFVYYEPTTRDGKGTYFGYGKLGRIFVDKREKDHYFAEIADFKPFSSEVSFLDEEGVPRESGPSYNPQNAARKISPAELDAICMDGGIVVSFIAEAHLIRVLGEELIASEVVGILELVKNAYDANASECRIWIEGVPNLPGENDHRKYPSLCGPVIVVEDNGHGMDRHSIENGWMRPASTLKTQVKERLKEEKIRAIQSGNLGQYNALVSELKERHKGRIPLGEKGVGRFAAHRLGQDLALTTKPADSDFEYLLEIDWRKLDSNGNLDLSSIGFALKRQKVSRDYGKNNSGTRLVISGGRHGFSFTEESIREINRSILKLKSPKNTPNQFNVGFDCPQIPDLDETSIADEYPAIFTLTALVDEYGMAEIDLEFTPPKAAPMPAEMILNGESVDLRGTDEKDPGYWASPGGGSTHSKDKRDPECGPFYFEISAWYRAAPWMDGPNAKVFKDYLDNYGGISIYRDGLNIFPAEWGSEVDWLSLSKRHIKKGLNISYYNMIGVIDLEQSRNLNLIDKTDRQGLLENTAFRDLSRLTRNLILQLENHFKGKRDIFTRLTHPGILREPKKLGEVAKQGRFLVERLNERYDVVEDTFEILEGFGPPDERKEKLLNLSRSLKEVQKSIETMQEVQGLLSEQAGYGLAIGVAVHEVAKLTSNFYSGVTQLLRQDEPDRAKLEELRDASSSLKTELKRFAPFRAIKNEPPAVFNVSKAIRFVKSVFAGTFEKERILLEISFGGGFDVFARYGALNQILSNLFDNSRYWLKSENQPEKKIALKIDNDSRSIVVADSGPGVDASIRPYLFEPGYSLKIPPSGLGLYICKYYMRAMGGDISEVPEKYKIPSLSGAQFLLDFSRVPKDQRG